MGHRWNRSAAAVAGLLAGSLLVVGTPATAVPAPAAAVAPQAVRSPIPKSPLCRQALDKIELYRNSSAFQAPDQLTILDQTVTVDLDHLDPLHPPFTDPSRVMWYRSMLWLVVAAVDAAEHGQYDLARDLASRAKAGAAAIPDPGTATPEATKLAVAIGWDAGTTIRRAEALLCLSTFTGAAALDPLLRLQAAALMDPVRYGGPPYRAVSNAGWMANLVLLNIAQAIRAPGVRGVAVGRLLRDQSQVFSPMGWTNEASTSYHSVNVRGWRDVQAVLRQRGYRGEAQALEARLTAATRTAAQLVGPTGQQVLIGNSRPDDVIVRPSGRGMPLLSVDVPGGLAIGRWSRTGRGTTWWTAQNRLLKGAHGHRDNLAVTWQTDGLPVLVDPGQPDYDRKANPMTAWSMTPEAHNRPVPGKVRKDTLEHRELRVARRGPVDLVSMVTTDLGSTQSRRMLVDDRRGAVEVVDSGERRMTQHWHLAQGWHVVRVTGHQAELAGLRGRRLTVTSPDGVITALRGSTDPIAGWLVTGFERQLPAVELRIAGPETMTTTFDLHRSTRTRPAPVPEITGTTKVRKRAVSLRWTLTGASGQDTEPMPAGDGNNDDSVSATSRRRGTAKVVGYRIQVKSPDTGWTTTVRDTGDTSLGATIKRLRTGAPYRFRVAALTRHTVGAYSPSRRFTPTSSG